MGGPISHEKRVMIQAKSDLGENISRISEELCLDWRTVKKYRETDRGRFTEAVQAIKRAHAEDCYALAHALRDKAWDSLENVQVKDAGDLRNVVVSSAVMIDKGLAVEGKAPGQVPSAFNLYLNSLNRQTQINISPTEARNLVKEQLDRKRLEEERQRHQQGVDIEPE
jgi:hypothetical protein